MSNWMKKRRGQVSTVSKLSRRRVAIYGTLIAISSAIGLFSYYSAVPVNGTSPVLGFPTNHFIKASHSGSSFFYINQGSSSVKGARTNGGGITNPSYLLTKGNLQSIHFTNGDYDTHSKHNFNIDAFNVHTRDLGYFESQTITFLADKAGTFEYYCTLHPEMKGNITIE
jgi:hypothetical protein